MRLDFEIPRNAWSSLPQSRLSRIVKGMEVHFIPEQETQLSKIATHAGTDPEQLVKDAAFTLA